MELHGLHAQLHDRLQGALRGVDRQEDTTAHLKVHKRPIDLSFRDCWAKQLFPDGFEFVAISPKESTEKHTKGVLLFSQGFGSSVLLCSNSYNIIIYDIMTQVRPRVGTGGPSAGPG